MKTVLSLLAAGIFAAPIQAALVDTVLVPSPQSATVDGTVGGGEYYTTVSGGGGGFGGPVGGSTLNVSADGNGIYLGFAGLGDYTGNAIRVFFDSKTGGFTDNSGFNDTADFGRERLSEIGSPLTFPFAADYGFIISPAFGGFQALFELANGGSGSFTFSAGVVASAVGESPTASTFEAFIPYSSLGTTVGSPIDFFVMYANHDSPAYISNEAFPFQGDGTEGVNFGNGAVTFSNYHRIQLIPEPASLVLCLAGGALMLARRRCA